MGNFLKVFASWRMAVVMLHGLAAGIPYALTVHALQPWMKDEGVDLTLIGIYSLVGLPYTIKFLWAPFMDRYTPPFLGRRRGWMIIAQIMLLFTITSLGFTHPTQSPWTVAFICVLITFASASQDIVIDAYRTEILEDNERGIGSSLYIMGYRLAVVIAGSISLILADYFSWKTAYMFMSASMLIGIVTTLLAPEPKVIAPPPKNLQEAVVHPFLEFFRRKGAIEILLFLLIYKIDAALTQALMTPFFMDMGFSKTEIGVLAKSTGTIATIAGTFIGGAIMLRVSMERSLWIFGIAQALAGGSFMLLSIYGKSYSLLMVAMASEFFFSGMSTAAFAAFIMSCCNKRFTATQYALLTSFMALSRYLVFTPSGYLAKTMGWTHYYLLCVLIGIPGLLLLTRYKKWTMPEKQTN